MKILEHILSTIIQEQVSLNDMQFSFMPGRGTTASRKAARKLLEKEEKHLLCICQSRKGF